jgi:hypothetical protein
MQTTEEQCKKIEDSMPKPRGKLKHDGLNALNALLCILEMGASGGAYRKNTAAGIPLRADEPIE